MTYKTKYDQQRAHDIEAFYTDKHAASTDLEDCPECDGTGEIILNSSLINDPQCEYGETCWMCKGTGEWDDRDLAEAKRLIKPVPDTYRFISDPDRPYFKREDRE